MSWLILITVVSGVCWWLVHKKLEAMLEYEFENRTDGGVIGFKAYKESKSHERGKYLFTSLNRVLFIIFALFLSITMTFGLKD